MWCHLYFDLCIHVHGGSMRGKRDILHLVNLIPLINIYDSRNIMT